MNKLKMKAKAGVTLVELLVVILIVTILSVSLLPLLKPYIEQAKYAAEAQPALADAQTKINLYQYEKDKLPCTDVTTAADGTKSETFHNDTAYTWMINATDSQGKARVFKKATDTGLTSGSRSIQEYTDNEHLSNFIEFDWQNLSGKRINPSHFQYHVIKGLGAAKYGYAIGIFGDGDGIAKGSGYAILVLVDTKAKVKVIATWERYKPATDDVVVFKAQAGGTPTTEDNCCYIPTAEFAFGEEGTDKSASDWDGVLDWLKGCGWSFNFDDVKSE